MNLTNLVDVLKQLPELLSLAFQTLLLGALEWLYSSSPVLLGWLALAYGGLLCFGAFRLQAWLRRAHEPESGAGRHWRRLIWRELFHSPTLWLLAAMVVATIVQLVRNSWVLALAFLMLGGALFFLVALFWLGRWAKARSRRRREAPEQGSGAEPSDRDGSSRGASGREPSKVGTQAGVNAGEKVGAGDGDDSDGEGEEKAGRPRLVLTLGPTYLLASMWVLGLYVLARVLDPLLAGRLSGVDGVSSWEVLLLGSWPKLELFLPLSERPYLSAILSLLLWVTLWWLISFGTRLRFQDFLLRNQLQHRSGSAPPQLRLWTEVGGAEPLWEPAENYRRWMFWVVAAATAVPPLAWLHLTGDPYRLDPSMFALAVVLWLGLVLNFLLRGEEVLPAAQEVEQEKRTLPPTAGWAEVCEVLQRGKVRVGPREDSTDCHQLTAHSWPPSVTPLARELLPRHQGGGLGAPTRLQAEILGRLGSVPGQRLALGDDDGDLSFGKAPGDAAKEEFESRTRHHAVLAPEGSGKTTLALLAAVDQAVTQTRCTLVVLRKPEEAERFRGAFQDALSTSSLRWTIRVRQPGHDLMNDLGRGIVPDVVVCSLRDLVVHVLERSDVFAPFLGNVGLVVLDDVESLFGPVEAHAKLAFRRLQLRLQALSHHPENDPRYGVSFLTLGADSMHRAEEWVETLLGVEVAVHTYGTSGDSSSEGSREGAAGVGAASGGADSPSSGGAVVRRELFRLRSFLDESQESITFLDLVQACEDAAVPWLYRYCGDGSRHLGRRLLPLREEPQHAVQRPEDAAVLLLEGTWSELHREIERLPYAGRRFLSGEPERQPPVGPIALVTFTDPDVESAFSYDDDSMPLAHALRSMPRPILRPPTGEVVEPHLAADLVQHWIEVHELVTAFGEPVVGRLTQLQRDGLLQQDAITDIAERESRYERKVSLQAHARALRGEQDWEDSTQSRRLLPPRVAQVELAVPEAIELRDRTRMEVLDQVEVISAMMLYYPGSIFRDARGTFVVAEWVTRANEHDHRVVGAVVVEPIQSLEITSPRRRVMVSWHDEGEEEVAAPAAPDGSVRESPSAAAQRDLRIAAGGGFLERHEILSGQLPMEVELRPATVEVEHVATFRLTPLRRRVMQRSLEPTAEPGMSSTSHQPWNRTFQTVALGLYPNIPMADAVAPERLEHEGELTVGGARLLAAAMRAVLPCLYRGGGSALGLALLLQPGQELLQPEPDQAPENSGLEAEGEGSETVDEGVSSGAFGRQQDLASRVLTADEGFVFFDTARGGNGACRAIYRDGVELLLRLCQLLLEGLPSVQRLRLLYDHFGDRVEILREAAEEEAGPRDRRKFQQLRNESNKDALHNARQWLEAHLGSEAAQGLDGEPQIDEDDDWDKFFPPSLGRCLTVAPGHQPDVKWALLRWRQRAENYEIRVGFDRETLLRSSGASDSKLVAQQLKLLRAEAQQQGDLAFAPWPAGTHEVSPPAKDEETEEPTTAADSGVAAAERPSWWIRLLVLLRLRSESSSTEADPGDAGQSPEGTSSAGSEAESSDEQSSDREAPAEWAAFASAWTVYLTDGYRLGRVAHRLWEGAGKGLNGDHDLTPMNPLVPPRLGRLHFLMSFVSSLRGDEWGTFEPLVQSLLQNRVNGATRCLLLAALLERNGVSSGVFVHRRSQRVLLAMEVSQGLSRFASQPSRREDPRSAWSTEANLGAPPSLFFELRVKAESLARLPAATAEHLPPLCFVPVDPSNPRPFAGPRDEVAKDWTFLPLGEVQAWLRRVSRAQEEEEAVSEEPSTPAQGSSKLESSTLISSDESSESAEGQAAAAEPEQESESESSSIEVEEPEEAAPPKKAKLGRAAKLDEAAKLDKAGEPESPEAEPESPAAEPESPAAEPESPVEIDLDDAEREATATETAGEAS
ncbi:MAG: hypothetical protein AAGD01_19905 [Acidobacteriota bacterium]